MENLSMVMDRKTLLRYTNFSQLDPQIRQHSGKLFCGYQQTDCKVYREKQKTQNHQQNTREVQSRKTDTIFCQDLL